MERWCILWMHGNCPSQGWSQKVKGWVLNSPSVPETIYCIAIVYTCKGTLPDPIHTFLLFASGVSQVNNCILLIPRTKSISFKLQQPNSSRNIILSSYHVRCWGFRDEWQSDFQKVFLHVNLLEFGKQICIYPLIFSCAWILFSASIFP